MTQLLWKHQSKLRLVLMSYQINVSHVMNTLLLICSKRKSHVTNSRKWCWNRYLFHLFCTKLQNISSIGKWSVFAKKKVSIVKGERYSVAKRKVSLSGDAELNPGPVWQYFWNNGSFTNQNFVLRYRLLRHGLQPLDVGGEGDCFFKSISHQLYGDSNHHAEIRANSCEILIW